MRERKDPLQDPTAGRTAAAAVKQRGREKLRVAPAIIAQRKQKLEKEKEQEK